MHVAYSHKYLQKNPPILPSFDTGWIGGFFLSEFLAQHFIYSQPGLLGASSGFKIISCVGT